MTLLFPTTRMGPCVYPWARLNLAQNMYCVIRGEKHFTLLPPSDVLFLYEQEYAQGRYRRKSEGGGFEVEMEEGTVPWIPVGENGRQHARADLEEGADYALGIDVTMFRSRCIAAAETITRTDW